MAVSFVLVVILPLLVSAFYLYTRAADQYASYVGFSVRSESAAPNAAEVLGALGRWSGPVRPPIPMSSTSSSRAATWSSEWMRG
ncbi:hypothetical protein ACFSYD_25465 [Paracoccus aerius]